MGPRSKKMDLDSTLNFRRVTHFWLCLLETQGTCLLQLQLHINYTCYTHYTSTLTTPILQLHMLHQPHLYTSFSCFTIYISTLATHLLYIKLSISQSSTQVIRHTCYSCRISYNSKLATAATLATPIHFKHLYIRYSSTLPTPLHQLHIYTSYISYNRYPSTLAAPLNLKKYLL